MELKKELPQITKRQEEIIDFWNARGYEKLTHTLGLNISLHKQPKYECLGLNLQYLEQFYRQAQLDVIKMMDDIIEEEKARCGEANAINCWVFLRERITKNAVSAGLPPPTKDRGHY